MSAALICLIIALVVIVLCMIGILEMSDEISSLKRTRNIANDAVDGYMKKAAASREQVESLKLANTKLTDKHKAATRRIAELGRDLEQALKGGGE